MTIIGAASAVPLPHDPLALVRNSLAPHISTGQQLADNLNHVYAHRRKMSFAQALNLGNIPAGQAGTLSTWRNYIHTGRGSSDTDHLKLIFDMLLMPADNAAASDPYCFWTVEEVGSGSPVDSAEVRYNRVETGSTQADWLRSARIEHTVDPDTAYELTLKVVDYLRPVGVTVFEKHAQLFEDGETSATPRILGSDTIITDLQHNQLLQNSHALWLDNAAPLFGWSVDSDPDNGGDAPNRAANTYVNIFDATVTTFGAQSRGWKVQGQYHNSFHTSADIECVLAVCAKDSTAGNGDFQLQSTDGALATVSSFGTSPTWRTATFVLQGDTDTDKVDLWFKTAAGTLTLYAVAAYEKV